MADEHLGFVDWMKAVGLFLIVYGHVAIGRADIWLPPIYPKQLGVSCFIFVLGFMLAREGRHRLSVLFSRLFPILLYGFVGAVLISVVRLFTVGDLNESNYLPLLGGVNVFFDNFPANPTTWYIGTYLHILLVWALVVHRLQVSPVVLVVAFLAEIATRASLSAYAGLFVAYQLWTNWILVFLVGRWFGQRSWSPRTPSWARLAVGACALLAWHLACSPLVVERSFPFMRMLSWSATGASRWLPTALAVSLIYPLGAFLLFWASATLQAPPLVRFVSRNTIVVFILHMPVFYAMAGLVGRIQSSFIRGAVYLFVTFVCLLVVSELVNRFVVPSSLSKRVLAALTAMSNDEDDGGVTRK